MKKFAFISRHEPTQKQIEIARNHDIEIVWVGDRDAFKVEEYEFREYHGCIVVHPAMALRLLNSHNTIGVFENSNRDGKFEPIELHLYAAVEWVHSSCPVPMLAKMK